MTSVTFPTTPVYAKPKSPAVTITAPPALATAQAPTIAFPKPSVVIPRPGDVIFPFRSLRTGETFSGLSASLCIGPAANLPVICALKDDCASRELKPPKSWSPKGKLLWGWVSCLHLIEGKQVWVNLIATPNGRGFIVGIRPRYGTESQQALPLHDLNEALVVYWGEQYLLQLATQPAVRTLMAAHGAPETAAFALPEFTIVESCGDSTAGIARGDTSILVSSWVLYDQNETESTLRHELAHIIVNRCGLKESVSHGENFKLALQTIAPTTWEEDWYCTTTPAMRAARERIHGAKSQAERQVCEVA